MMIEGYERRIANFGERWFTMVEQQDEHRRELERHTIFDDGRRAWAGVICGFVLCMTALIVALILGLNRHDAGGTILSGVIGTSGIVGLAWVFVHGTKVRRQEREDKARIMMGQQVPPR